MRFFHLNFQNARENLAAKIYDAGSVLSQLVSGEPQYTGISRPKET